MEYCRAEQIKTEYKPEILRAKMVNHDPVPSFCPAD